MRQRICAAQKNLKLKVCAYTAKVWQIPSKKLSISLPFQKKRLGLYLVLNLKLCHFAVNIVTQYLLWLCNCAHFKVVYFFILFLFYFIYTKLFVSNLGNMSQDREALVLLFNRSGLTPIHVHTGSKGYFPFPVTPFNFLLGTFV